MRCLFYTNCFNLSEGALEHDDSVFEGDRKIQVSALQHRLPLLYVLASCIQLHASPHASPRGAFNCWNMFHTPLSKVSCLHQCHGSRNAPRNRVLLRLLHHQPSHRYSAIRPQKSRVSSSSSKRTRPRPNAANRPRRKPR